MLTGVAAPSVHTGADTRPVSAAPSGGVLHVLVLEDVPADAALIEDALRQDGLLVTVQCANTEQAFRKALEAFAPDIVLSDYALPGLDGLSALYIVREHKPDLPFILVTARLGDEAAVAAVKAGANDYVRKDRLARLPMAVRNALAEATASRRKRVAEENLVSLAHADVLTGLDNRAGFLDRLRDSFAAARRGRYGFAVFYVDLDHFKDVNDSLGHPAGDRLLREVADRLRRAVRETDSVARFGGDEFAVLQRDVIQPSDAGTLAAKLLTVLAVPLGLNGTAIHVTASIGIALYRPGTSIPEDMLSQADLALYRAKDEGRNRYCFHSAELDETVRERLELTEALHEALEHNQFELYYQPQTRQAEGRIVGLEALIRWHHPRRGRLLPGAFIPVAEQAGLMPAIGRWVLNTVCEQIASWRREGISVVRTAINLSPAQFRESMGFSQEVAKVLERWGVPPELIELELSEANLIETAREHGVDLQRVRLLGLNLVVDEFGTGSFSLHHISSFGFSRLKIAPRLIAGAADNSSTTALVRAALGLARELTVQVIAVGVETAAQLDFLTAAGCEMTQGYHICPPVPADKITALLREGRIVPGSCDDWLEHKASGAGGG